MNQIRHFLAVMEAGSLRAAARSVGVSQPAITKSIRQLEAQLGVQLVQRSARGAVATPAGKAFLARARIVQAELRKAVEDLGPFQGGASGSVAFGISGQAAMLIVPEAMRQFRRRYPDAQVRILEGVGTALLPAVRDASLDFVVGISVRPAAEPGLACRPLMRLPLVVAGRQGHPLSAATSLRELAGASWIVHYPTGLGAPLENAFAAAGLAMPRAVVRCESCATALALISGTDTLGLVTPYVLQQGFGRHRIQQVRIRESIPAPLLGLYHRRDAPLTAAAAALVQALTASARRFARERQPVTFSRGVQLPA
ncbi:MAG TPA: LysR substrate-binding domain-containing protein [Burkholderiales bacterium]|nr:LysR substrate-binding domain-containing protein [Burkholderiales bacterium]